MHVWMWYFVLCKLSHCLLHTWGLRSSHFIIDLTCLLEDHTCDPKLKTSDLNLVYTYLFIYFCVLSNKQTVHQVILRTGRGRRRRTRRWRWGPCCHLALGFLAGLTGSRSGAAAGSTRSTWSFHRGQTDAFPAVVVVVAALEEAPEKTRVLQKLRINVASSCALPRRQLDLAHCSSSAPPVIGLPTWEPQQQQQLHAHSNMASSATGDREEQVSRFKLPLLF